VGVPESGSDVRFRDLIADRSTAVRYTAVLGLQFGQVLPLSFVGLMLPIVFREQGLALNMFWVFAIPSLPVWLRPLWAPLVDRYGSARFGRRKSWFLPCTIMGALSYTVLSMWQPIPENLALIIALLTVTSTFMTTQDVAIDGYMIENIHDHERPVAAAALDVCRNVSMFVAWGGLVFIYSHFGWSYALLSAAGLLVFFSIPAFIRKEPPPPQISLRQRPSLMRLLRRRDAQMVLPLCFAVGLFGGFAASLYPTFLVDKGFTSAQVALIAGPATLIGTLIGATITASFLRRFGYRATLGVACVVVCFGSFPIAWLALQPEPGWLLVFCITLNGLALPSFLDVGFQAVRLKWASKSQAGTEYTTQIVLLRAGFSSATALGGLLAFEFGWFRYFLIAGVSVSCVAFLLWRLYDRVEGLVDQRDEAELSGLSEAVR